MFPPERSQSLPKLFVLPELTQPFAGDLARTNSWTVPGGALGRSLPLGNGGKQCILAVLPHHQLCSLRAGPGPRRSQGDEKAFLMKRAESEEGNKRSGRTKWQLRPSSAFGRDLVKEPRWRQ